MFEKVRSGIDDRGNGSTPQADPGLSDGRLALVHRYMIDAEEAEALAQAAAEKVAARAQVGVAVAQLRPQPEAVEQERVGTTIAGQVEVPVVEAAKTRLGADVCVAEETLQRAPTEARTNGASRVVEEAATANDGPDPRRGAPAHKTLVKADRSAAKKAARELASLEKKEARERRALAKAAARRH